MELLFIYILAQTLIDFHRFLEYKKTCFLEGFKYWNKWYFKVLVYIFSIYSTLLIKESFFWKLQFFCIIIYIYIYCNSSSQGAIEGDLVYEKPYNHSSFHITIMLQSVNCSFSICSSLRSSFQIDTWIPTCIKLISRS